MSTPLLATPGRDGEPTRMLAAGTLGVGLAALPEDLLENTMLGDTGANAIGACWEPPWPATPAELCAPEPP